MARYDDLNTTSIAYATFISAVVLFVIILLIQALTYNWLTGEAERKLATSHYISADAEIKKQKARLDGYQQVMVEVIPPAADGAVAAEAVTSTKEKRIYIPMEQAESLILKEFNKPTEPAAGT